MAGTARHVRSNLWRAAAATLARMERHGRSRVPVIGSAIIAAALAFGCRELYTEDRSRGCEAGEVSIVDPLR
jgi:predicted nucleic acid-binding protein